MAGARRFVLEAVFLACLAVAAGLADLTTPQIIGVMAIGWVVTVLIELVTWRLSVRHPAAVAVPEPVAEPEVVEQAALPEPVAEPETEPTPRKRGLFRRGGHKEEPEAVEEVPEPPRHVRLIEPSDGEDTGTEDEPHQRAEGE
jgi:hypothetical protein